MADEFVSVPKARLAYLEASHAKYRALLLEFRAVRRLCDELEIRSASDARTLRLKLDEALDERVRLERRLSEEVAARSQSDRQQLKLIRKVNELYDIIGELQDSSGVLHNDESERASLSSGQDTNDDELRAILEDSGLFVPASRDRSGTGGPAEDEDEDEASVKEARHAYEVWASTNNIS